jgi:BirA family transcriptional regulator, biotin operon repressor / biotin---[acetyl-CoA-carboxylase] ligase
VSFSEEWNLPNRYIGRRVLVFDRLDSTNSKAASLPHDAANDGIVVLAREQTAGRGQHGRHWECPRDMGVLLSVLLFPPPALRRPAVLTAWAAVSVCEAILRVTGLQARIKWPNDVYVRGRKVCGILIEQGKGTAVGIGLNVNQSAESFATAGLALGGSLRVFTGQMGNCDEVAKLLIDQLDEEYERLNHGDLDTLEACWKWRFGLLGKQVVLECVDARYEGRLLDMGFDGLCLERVEEGIVVFRPEMVKHLVEV